MSFFHFVIASQARKIAETALETSPYNAIAYGVLVLVLIAAVVFVWREYKRTLERHKDYVEKTAAVIQIVESKLDSIDNLERQVGNLNNEISNLKDRTGQLSEYINLLRGNDSN